MNSVLNEDLAPVGNGQAVTKENHLYSKVIVIPNLRNSGGNSNTTYNVNLYDTVGLEIDKKITERTLHKIKDRIQQSRCNSADDALHLVWFCVSEQSSRFEPYEVELIKSLSIDYEIPFILVLTQCSTGQAEMLERQIKTLMPELPTVRVLAKGKKIRGGGIIHAFGVSDLLRTSISDYDKLKTRILEEKIIKLEAAIASSKESRVNLVKNRGQEIILANSKAAEKAGIVPLGCIPFIHGICIKMIVELNNLIGIGLDKEFASELFNNVILGVVATPFMALPILSSAVASAYVETVGEGYMKAVISVLESSLDQEISNTLLIKERLRKELQTIKQNGRKRE